MNGIVNGSKDDMELVDKKRHQELLDAELLLNCMYAGGVDNWEWYSEAIKLYQETKAKEGGGE